MTGKWQGFHSGGGGHRDGDPCVFIWGACVCADWVSLGLWIFGGHCWAFSWLPGFGFGDPAVGKTGARGGWRKSGHFRQKRGQLGRILGGRNGLSRTPPRDLPSHVGGHLGFGQQVFQQSRHQPLGGKLHLIGQNQWSQLDHREPNSKNPTVPVRSPFVSALAFSACGEAVFTNGLRMPFWSLTEWDNHQMSIKSIYYWSLTEERKNCITNVYKSKQTSSPCKICNLCKDCIFLL